MTDFMDNCRLELEDRELLDSLPEAPMMSSQWQAFSRPAEVAIDWHRTENQGPIGSCQGNGLTSILERLALVLGKKIQLSRIFAYLATQKIDGLLGSDRGSTISGGGKLAVTHGVPLESLTGYPSRYPGKSEITKILNDANYAAGSEYKAKSIWKVPQDVAQCMDFIGGGGGISIGIAWNSRVIPADRIVTKFAPSGRTGGHAMAVLGYTLGGSMIAVNSHGDGRYEWTPEAWLQMLKHPRTAAIGLMGSEDAQPVNWYENSPYFS